MPYEVVSENQANAPMTTTASQRRPKPTSAPMSDTIQAASRAETTSVANSIPSVSSVIMSWPGGTTSSRPAGPTLYRSLASAILALSFWSAPIGMSGNQYNPGFSERDFS